MPIGSVPAMVALSVMVGSFSAVIPGRASSREPEIQGGGASGKAVWIPGSGLRPAPNDGVNVLRNQIGHTLFPQQKSSAAGGGLEPGFAAGLGQFAHPQDVALALGD